MLPEGIPLALASTDVSSPGARLAADQRTTDWDAWFTPGRFCFLLGLLLIAAFPEVWFASHTFFYRDFGCFGYPLAAYHREAFWHGEIPLWNPLNHCGLPHLAQWNTMVFYPLSLLYLLGPLPWAVGWFSLGHLFLAGLGAYQLAFRWTGNRFAASVAGLAWALNGLSLHALMWPNNIAALAWMPWVLLVAGQAAQRGGRSLAGAAVVAALQILAGAPEITIVTWLMAGALCLADGGAPILSRLWRLAAVGLLSFGLTAMQMLPFLDLLRQSQRDANYATGVWSMPPWGLVNLVLPLFQCTPSLTGGVFSQSSQQWTSSYYPGIGVLGMAALALGRKAGPRAWVLAGIAILSLLVALGDATPLYPLCQRFLPGFGLIRFPIKFVVPALLCLPLLAAQAVADWRRLPAAGKQARRWSWLLAAAALLGLILVALQLAHSHPIPGGDVAATVQNGWERALFVVAVLGGLAWLPTNDSARSGWLLRWGLLLALGLDPLTHMPRQNPTVPVEAYAPVAALRTWTAPAAGERAIMHPRTKAFLDYAAHPDALLFTLGQRRALVPNWNLLEGIPVVGGFYALQPRQQRQVLDLLNNAAHFPEGLADFLSASRISSREELLDWENRPHARPWISAGQAPVFAEPEATLAGLASADFDPRTQVYLPPSVQKALPEIRTGQGRILSISQAGTRVRFEVEATAPTLVTLAQTHYPCWTARVNGEAVPIWRANHAFQAVLVPAGRSGVELAYRDRALQRGALLSVMTALGCALWAWRPGSARKACPGPTLT